MFSMFFVILFGDDATWTMVRVDEHLSKKKKILQNIKYVTDLAMLRKVNIVHQLSGAYKQQTNKHNKKLR